MSTTIYNRSNYRWLGETLALVEADFTIWCGPLAMAKKGRESAAKITDAQLKQMEQQGLSQQHEQQHADNTIGTWETQGQPGQLSPAAAAQLASDNNNIARTYNGMRQQAFASMGARGFGSAPSGFGLASQNAVNQGQANAGSEAFRNAQKNTQALQEAAVQARMGLSGQNLQGENAAANTGLTGAVDQSKMGSTLGDIGQGVSIAAGLVNPVVGAGQAIGKAFSKLGTYGGGSGGGYV